MQETSAAQQIEHDDGVIADIRRAHVRVTHILAFALFSEVLSLYPGIASNMQESESSFTLPTTVLLPACPIQGGA